MSKNLFSQIKQQKELSEGVMAALLPILKNIFYPDTTLDKIVYGDLGSFARGTNNEVSPDLDIGFFGVPIRTDSGYKDWTPIGTRELTGKKEGITSLEELGQYDPIIVQAIQQVQPVLETYFRVPSGTLQFNFLRSWAGYPGWVANLSLPHPEFGTIEIDLNLGYARSHYGIEHARRFDQYFNRVVADLGEERAVQLVEDIRLVKKLGKENARDAAGWIDRTKKLAGFVVEGLFMHQYPPHTYAELMELVSTYEWESGREPTEHWLGDQSDQIIAAGFSFRELLENLACDNEALPLGAWENLRRIAEASQDF